MEGTPPLRPLKFVLLMPTFCALRAPHLGSKARRHAVALNCCVVGCWHNSYVSEHGERNREGVERLRRLSSLTDSELAKETGNGWTVSTVLGHLAFYDRMLLMRWDIYEQNGVFAEMTPNHFDMINGAADDDWAALPPGAAVDRCIEAAEGAVARIDALPEHAVAVAMETNRVALLERMLHWYPHLTQIESAIGREI
jgi:hypothetical protein